MRRRLTGVCLRWSFYLAIFLCLFLQECLTFDKFTDDDGRGQIELQISKPIVKSFFKQLLLHQQPTDDFSDTEEDDTSRQKPSYYAPSRSPPRFKRQHNFLYLSKLSWNDIQEMQRILAHGKR